VLWYGLVGNVSRYSGNNEKCPKCGIRYKDFRASITSFQEAKDAMFVVSEDSKDWRYRRKNGVLGYWHSVKKKEWKYHLEECGLFLDGFVDKEIGEY